MSTFLKVIGALVVIWIGFMVVGWLVHAFLVLAIVGAVAALGVAGYSAIRNRNRKQIY
ncbi:MAG TPA: hypothetical protein VG247_30300 [Pseudonocardiaceae bacterium]|jgi:hypothetical protein|nr:hypothetical protein [Pseudonocardiaceae bacterium]